YIDTVCNRITQICNTLLSGGKFTPGDLRFGLVAFHNHPPQDRSFIIQEYPFTTDFGSIATNLGGLTATGGGDGPESQSDALSAATRADWKDKATKVVVLITDSPLHGIGEDGDAFPKGCPLHKSYLCSSVVMNQTNANTEINPLHIHVIACEPTLSQYYKVRSLSLGKVVNLGDVSVLPTLIACSALEAVDSENYVAKYQAEVHSMVNDQKMSTSNISQKLYRNFAAAGIQHSTLVVDNMYEECTQGDRNADIWFNAENLNKAKNNIQEVEGNHILEKYQTAGVEQSAAVVMQLISLAQVIFTPLISKFIVTPLQGRDCHSEVSYERIMNLKTMLFSRIPTCISITWLELCDTNGKYHRIEISGFAELWCCSLVYFVS
ncbi:uncharacterized protein BJ212DRAFT_1281279, partial [Suillus subaureus]